MCRCSVIWRVQVVENVDELERERSAEGLDRFGGSRSSEMTSCQGRFAGFDEDLGQDSPSAIFSYPVAYRDGVRSARCADIAADRRFSSLRSASASS